MTTDLERRVAQLVRAARELEPKARAAFIEHACEANVDLRTQVETRLAAEAAQTVTLRSAGGAVASPFTPAGSSSTIAQGRFLPGAMIAGRYRIVELLGKGGMGEVYRADDLTLGQSVALKFLPPDLARNTDWLNRFLGEVRIARQVTHPNVCRVYDIGQHAGEHFLTMEYVDGEDLGSLLRRVGRLTQEKAVQVARQLCAGLAAAHDKGVLHRDLKPANIMLDGQGRVRITDFGLAVPMAQLAMHPEAKAGTPAYMAPEQWTGESVSARSDLYALGLILYELFTGHRVFQAATLAEYAELHKSQPPTSPSQTVRDLDPAVERVILRCLAKNPQDRPASALAVSAALPGGDPLAEALAAGETPSPEMVANAGECHLLCPLRGTLLLGGIVAGVLVVLLLAPLGLLTARLPLPLAPAALADRAQQMAVSFGYREGPRDDAYGLLLDSEYLEEVERQGGAEARWDRLRTERPSSAYFWYRQSPVPFKPVGPRERVTPEDPAPRAPGMITLWLDPRGWLVRMEAVPPGQRRVPASTAAASQSASGAAGTDWSAVFKAANLDLARFTPAPPAHTPPVYADEVACWRGTYAEQPDLQVTVHAASFEGRPVYFEVQGSWHKLNPWERLGAKLRESSQRDLVELLVYVVVLAGGSIMAWVNLRAGRGDRRGAFRVAAFVFVTWLVIWLLRLEHIHDTEQFLRSFSRNLANGLFVGGLMWVYYIALEPSARRIWPETIISWARLLAGRWRDPLVGRDVLIGAVIGAWAAVFVLLDRLLPGWLGWASPMPRLGVEELDVLLGGRAVLHWICYSVLLSVYYGMAYLLLAVLLRAVLRGPWLAFGAFVVVMTAVFAATGAHRVLSWLVFLPVGLAVGLALTRVGLVAMIAGSITFQLLISYPQSYNFSVWYASGAVLSLVAVGALVVVAYINALFGRAAPADE